MTRKDKLEFDYSDLQKMIIKKCGTMTSFSEHIGWDKSYLSNKLAGRVRLSVDDIARIAYALSIPDSLIGKYFFTFSGERKLTDVDKILSVPIEDFDVEID